MAATAEINLNGANSARRLQLFASIRIGCLKYQIRLEA